MGLLALLLVIAAVFPKLAAAQSGTSTVTDDEVNDIAKELFCPVCESTPLDVCPTQACADWREIIRTKLAEGQTEQQIKDYFVDQYGPRALAEPPQEGFTLAVWVIPIAAVVVGGFFFSRYVRSLQSGGTAAVEDSKSIEPSTSPGEPAPDDYASRIERELRERGK
jgi:cytochrome c-type biogenesis protein CcmH